MSREGVLELHGGKSSSFVLACLAKPGLEPPGRALDIPCGFGRHASLFAQMGFTVVALDIDPARVAVTNGASAGSGTISAVTGDAAAGLPFERDSFDLAVIVHYVSPRILRDVEAVLRPGGHLVFETFGAQGQNWIDLPKPREVSETLRPGFEILVYRERKAGPDDQAVSVKLLARKR